MTFLHLNVLFITFGPVAGTICVRHQCALHNVWPSSRYYVLDINVLFITFGLVAGTICVTFLHLNVLFITFGLVAGTICVRPQCALHNVWPSSRYYLCDLPSPQCALHNVWPSSRYYLC